MKIIVCFGFLLGAVSVAGKVFYTKLGQSVILECGVNSYTRTLLWRRGDDLIISLDRRSFPRRGRSDTALRSRLKQDINLEISGVRESDAGTFTCVADGTTNTHTLAVVSVSPSPSAELEVGSKTTFQCEVIGPPLDYTGQWKRPDGGFESKNVELNPVAKSHTGTWMCIISYKGETHIETLDVRVKDVTPTQSSIDHHNPKCPNSPLLDESTVSRLHVGFPLEACKKAVYYSGNTGIHAAMNWIMSHMDDPDFSAPLELPSCSSGPEITPTESL